MKDSESFEPQKFYSRLRIGITSFPKVRVVRDFIFSLYDVICKYVFLSMTILAVARCGYTALDFSIGGIGRGLGAAVVQGRQISE